MKITLFIVSVFLLSACSTVTPPGTTTPPVSSGSNISHIERLTTGIQYGSGQHTATLFADFQCPACIQFADSVMPMLESYAASGKLQITYKQFPLTTIHKNAYRDSLAAFCADEQGKFMDYKKALYALEEEKAGASISDDDRIMRAEEVGIDPALFTTCLSTDKYKSRVDADMADGDALGVQGTPTLFFDGKKIDFSVFQNMEQISQFFATRL